eukprot:1710680-Amphidinium_carterae.1
MLGSEWSGKCFLKSECSDKGPAAATALVLATLAVASTSSLGAKSILFSAGECSTCLIKESPEGCKSCQQCRVHNWNDRMSRTGCVPSFPAFPSTHAQHIMQHKGSVIRNHI